MTDTAFYLAMAPALFAGALALMGFIIIVF